MTALGPAEVLVLKTCDAMAKKRADSVRTMTDAFHEFLRVSATPIVSPCFYGIDMPTQQELIAAGRSVDEIRDLLGADSLAYLSLEGLQTAIQRPAERFCRACLTGIYPVPVPGEAGSKLRFEREPARA